MNFNEGKSQHEWVCCRCDGGFQDLLAVQNHGVESGHRPFKCWCNQEFEHYSALLQHNQETGHCSFKCRVAKCDEFFVSQGERAAHENTPHNSGHKRIHPDHPHHCFECNQDLSSKAELLRHARVQQHKPYICDCGTSFSRIDVLNRHLKSFSTDIPQHPCPFCRRHRGINGFRRKDHLLQHFRQYHHHDTDTTHPELAEYPAPLPTLQYRFPVCTHLECPQYRSAAFQELPLSAKKLQAPFQKQSEYTRHMRDEHNECTYPCDILGCSRIGRKGYFREKDLIKHRQQEHPDAETYKPSAREVKHRCTEPGCDAIVDLSSMPRHALTHWY
jgi:hypothetical protein